MAMKKEKNGANVSVILPLDELSWSDCSKALCTLVCTYVFSPGNGQTKSFFKKKIQLKSVKLIFLYIESKKLYRKPGPSPQEATVARKTLEQDQRVPPLMIVGWVETEEKEGGQIRREEYINYNKLSV